jgi:hypothetical protein
MRDSVPFERPRKALARALVPGAGMNQTRIAAGNERPNGQALSRLKMVGEGLPGLTIKVDENGSPVKVDPVDWFICFVPGLQRQWWHRFVHRKHTHVFAMRPTSEGNWLLVEPWWSRMMVTVLPPADAVKFLQWGAMGDVLRVREAIPGNASQLRGWSNCAVLTSFVLGRPSWTWTPHGLYRELLREKDTRRVNVAQLLADQFAEAGDHSFNPSRVGTNQPSLPLGDLLFIIGRGLLETMPAPALLDVWHTAVREAGRCTDAARFHAQSGPKRALAILTKILATARQAGEVNLADCEAGARQFLGMLCVNTDPKAMRLGEILTPGEIDARARAAVRALLGGRPIEMQMPARQGLLPRKASARR